MKIIIKTRNLELDEKFEDYINGKIKHLEKFIKLCHSTDEWEKIKSNCEVFVEVEKETQHHKKGCIFNAKAYVRLPGKTIEAEANDQSPKAAIDKLKDEFLNEIKKYKSRKISLDRRRQRRAKKEFHLAPEARLYRKGRIREEGM